MIILSVGMPRAGSGWYYNLTNDLMVACGARDGREIRKRYHLQKILSEVNCNIGALTPRRLLAVLVPAMMGNTFVIKAHAAPTPFAIWLIQRGWILPTYIFRDPRDAMLSAFENGQRAIQRGRPNAFSSLCDFDAALQFMLDYLRIGELWLKCQQILLTRYENLLENYTVEATRLVDFLRLPKDVPDVVRVIEAYRPGQTQPDQKGLHFSHGRIGRFRHKWSPKQQAILVQVFKPYLERMGYGE